MLTSRSNIDWYSWSMSSFIQPGLYNSNPGDKRNSPCLIRIIICLLSGRACNRCKCIIPLRACLNMKPLLSLLICLAFSGCMSKNYPLTTFYVKNNTDQTVNFKATVLKLSAMGPFEMTLPFMVLPQDSVLARRVNFKKDALPNHWFSQFLML